jgi:hypothetical protein
LVVLAVSAPRAAAQCGQADGLDGGPCCAAAFAQIPQIPAFQTDARFICFDNCAPALNTLYCANLGPPIPMGSGGAIVCGAYFIRLRLKVCGTTNFVWLGALNAMYSRNWLESSVPGTVNLTVWRFIVNGDFLPTASLPNTPCDKPGCTVQFTRVYFSGHVDYAYDCITNTWSVAFAINHECDGIHHQPGTARPAPASGFHPTRNFSIVGPGSTFAVASTGAIRSDGPINQQAIRWNNWGPAPVACTFEEPASGFFQAQNDVCFCATASPNLQYTFSNVSAFGACGSAINPVAGFPFLQKRIGAWTSATTFPGQEFVLFDVGRLGALKGCTGVNSIEWFEGSETIGGFPAYEFSGLALDPEFEDLGSANNSFTNPAVKIGAPHVSNCILNFNLP